MRGNTNQLLILLVLFVGLSGMCQAQRYAHKKQKWKQLGPIELPTPMGTKGSPNAHGMGLIQSLYVSPSNHNYILAGSNSGGIYKTVDGGKIWKSLNNFGLVTGVLDIEVDPINQDEIWIATGTVVHKDVFGHGLLHSTDGGKSWSKTGLDFVPFQKKVVWQVARSLSNPNVFYASTRNEVYRSTNRGHTWRMMYDGPKTIDFRELIIHPKNENYVVVSGEEMLITKDGGMTWTLASEKLEYKKIRSRKPPNRIAVNLLPDRDSGLIVLYRAGSKNYIERSLDWGNSWQLTTVNRTFNRVDKANAEISVPKGAESTIFVGSVRAYKSTNGGARFNQITFPLQGNKAYLHDDIREMVLIDSNTIFVACDGGVSKTLDGGETWKDISGRGLTVTQFYGIAQSPTDKYPVIGGCQDISSIVFTKDSTFTTGHIFGDGGNCIIDGEGNWYIMQNGYPRMSPDSGKTWKRLRTQYSPNSYDFPFQLDPANEKYFYIADHYLYRSSRDGKISNLSKNVPKNSNKIRELDINKGDPQSIFFAKDEPTWGDGDLLKNKLYRTVYTSDTMYWEDITQNLGILAWRSVSGITSNKNNKHELWISMYGGAREDGLFTVFHSTNRGDTWEDYSNGLSFYNTYAIEHLENSRSSLFLACDNGIYFRNSKTDEWVKLRGKLPEIMVKSVAINYKKRRLRVGTYGCGIWEMKIPRRMMKF
jgi:photosystem II stability/assembly factor-like uncharacterized protein